MLRWSVRKRRDGHEYRVEVAFTGFELGYLNSNGVGVNRTHDDLAEVISTRNGLAGFVVLEEEGEEVSTLWIIYIWFSVYHNGFSLPHQYSSVGIITDCEFDGAFIGIPP